MVLYFKRYGILALTEIEHSISARCDAMTDFHYGTLQRHV